MITPPRGRALRNRHGARFIPVRKVEVSLASTLRQRRQKCTRFHHSCMNPYRYPRYCAHPLRHLRLCMNRHRYPCCSCHTHRYGVAPAQSRTCNLMRFRPGEGDAQPLAKVGPLQQEKRDEAAVAVLAPPMYG
eukprot:GHVU01071832.1.p1 GENE.GHVU01071832.1~~GHVU01071832.1.p1  ORF type:complete len:133 (+),score=2.12 GHVU01071832.1:736-1134(+)